MHVQIQLQAAYHAMTSALGWTSTAVKPRVLVWWTRTDSVNRGSQNLRSPIPLSNIITSSSFWQQITSSLLWQQITATSTLATNHSNIHSGNKQQQHPLWQQITSSSLWQQITSSSLWQQITSSSLWQQITATSTLATNHIIFTLATNHIIFTLATNHSDIHSCNRARTVKKIAFMNESNSLFLSNTKHGIIKQKTSNTQHSDKRVCIYLPTCSS